MTSSTVGLVLEQGRAGSKNPETTCPPEALWLPCPIGSGIQLEADAEHCVPCLSCLTSWLGRLPVVAGSRMISCCPLL